MTWRLRRLGAIEVGLITLHLWRVAHERAVKQEQGLRPLSTAPPRRQMLDAKGNSTASVEERIAQVKGREEKEDAEEVLQGEAATLGEAFMRMVGKDALGKLSRYESNLERSLLRALHELQRLQAERKGAPVVPPIVVDVDLAGAQD